jgi:hypothetical protein
MYPRPPKTYTAALVSSGVIIAGQTRFTGLGGTGAGR